MSDHKINEMLDKGQQVYREYYDYKGCYNKILSKLDEWKD